MPQVNINTILARYQSGFGYVAGNVASRGGKPAMG